MKSFRNFTPHLAPSSTPPTTLVMTVPTKPPTPDTAPPTAPRSPDLTWMPWPRRSATVHHFANLDSGTSLRIHILYGSFLWRAQFILYTSLATYYKRDIEGERKERRTRHQSIHPSQLAPQSSSVTVSWTSLTFSEMLTEHVDQCWYWNTEL